MDLAGDLLDRTVTLMGLLCGRQRKRVVILGSGCRRLGGLAGFLVAIGWLLGRSDVLALLVEMAFGHRDQLRRVAS
jgi:hypothetical protein